MRNSERGRESNGMVQESIILAAGNWFCESWGRVMETNCYPVQGQWYQTATAASCAGNEQGGGCFGETGILLLTLSNIPACSMWFLESAPVISLSPSHSTFCLSPSSPLPGTPPPFPCHSGLTSSPSAAKTPAAVSVGLCRLPTQWHLLQGWHKHLRH